MRVHCTCLIYKSWLDSHKAQQEYKTTCAQCIMEMTIILSVVTEMRNIRITTIQELLQGYKVTRMNAEIKETGTVGSCSNET